MSACWAASDGGDAVLLVGRPGIRGERDLAGAMRQEHVDAAREPIGQQQRVAARPGRVGLVESVDDDPERPLGLGGGLGEDLAQERRVLARAGRQVVVGQAEAGDQLDGEVVEALVGPGQAAAGVGEEDGGFQPLRRRGGQGRLAQAGVGHDPEVTAGPPFAKSSRRWKSSSRPTKRLCHLLRSGRRSRWRSLSATGSAGRWPGRRRRSDRRFPSIAADPERPFPGGFGYLGREESPSISVRAMYSVPAPVS